VLALALALTANAPGAAARSNAASLTELAARADREGRVAEALRLFERAADEAPAARRGEALFNLGLFLHRSGDAARAAAVYESALAANPRLAAAWVKLASLHRDARRWDAAFAALQRALALTPRDASLYLVRVCAARRCGGSALTLTFCARSTRATCSTTSSAGPRLARPTSAACVSSHALRRCTRISLTRS
jgi:tetratricopeptide (TPR) repeat protein